MVAFAAGERVVVEAIVPHAERPDNKYVALSRVLQKRYLLSDADLAAPEAPACAAAPAVRESRRAFWLAAGLASLAVVAVITGLLFLHGGGGKAGGAVVCIDPGHGGSDTGALENGVAEKDVNLDIALRARALLEAKGCRVVMTRESDQTVSLAQRCAIANGAHASLLVSIHNNSRPPDVEGTTTYFCRGSDVGRRLAAFVQAEVVRRIGRPDRGVKDSGLYMVRNAAMPAALLEGVFLSSREEAWLITDAGFRRHIAEGVAAGIEDFLQSR
jgi:N-acetylmuramoyl-L-alanine amidase